ncbi:Uncharacterised protein [Vibrio cholerae]|nr:Uncharacterised protein [Vibrio cholerae]
MWPAQAASQSRSRCQHKAVKTVERGPPVSRHQCPISQQAHPPLPLTAAV